MNEISYGRTLMGDSLGFHILFALFGVGIPLIISLAELIGIWRKDNDFYTMAKRWSFIMGTLFVVGAISGTIISTQLSILWPAFMALAGKVIGLPFFMEAFAFFIEAIFLGIYLYSWDKFKNKYIHWLTSLPIVIGSVASAFFITTANAWMNSPAGFTYQNGVASNIDPIKAMFNAATPTETSHSIFSYYLTTALVFAAGYAWFLLRNKKPQFVPYYKKALTLLMALALFFALGIGLTGDSSGKYLAQHEPLKLAAAESLYNTQANAPLKIGGINTKDDNDYAIMVPGLLSFLAYGSTSAVVKGLNSFNPNLWPPLWIHYMFDFMVLCGTIITLAAVLFCLLYAIRKLRRRAFSKSLLWLIIISAPLAAFAVEFGWILTEVGRQPYAIAGIMTTNQAFTTAPNVAEFGFIFPSIYMVLLVLTPLILKWHYKKHQLEIVKENF